jgi:hypothetical protein
VTIPGELDPLLQKGMQVKLLVQEDGKDAAILSAWSPEQGPDKPTVSFDQRL